jgi:hypothetical protein
MPGAPSLNPFFGFKGGMRDCVHRDSWYPTLRKQREGPRISYCAAPAMGACAAFYTESRMKFVAPTKPYRRFGGMGHPQICYAFQQVTSSVASAMIERFTDRIELHAGPAIPRRTG